MDSLLAARLQMTVSLAFHMVFAAVGIGLPLLLLLVEGLWLRTGRPHYRDLARTWAKATGLLFAVGAISGTALSFELGLLWPRYMELTGAAVGHLFGLEGFAFFIEAIFIGLYLYGGDRLTPRGHWLCALVIATSGMISGVLVLGVNAWMQLPVGFEIDAATGRVRVTDPIAIFKQPAWAYMALHSTLACYLAVSFAVVGIYAAAWLRGRRDDYVRSAITVALGVGAVFAVLQPISGDASARFVYRTQPVKFAAMEGQFKTQTHAPLRLGGIPDEQAGVTRWCLEIPGGLSFLATHDVSAEVQGLEAFPRSDWPNVNFVHLAFQVMVGSGMALLAVSGWFWLLRWRRGERVFESRPLVWGLAMAGPLGFLGLEAGWVVTEAGRQPWVIHKLLRTSEAVTPAAGVPEMFFLFTALYLLLAVTVSVLLLKLRRAPDRSGSDLESDPPEL